MKAANASRFPLFQGAFIDQFPPEDWLEVALTVMPPLPVGLASR
jgi:hypothetical protein